MEWRRRSVDLVLTGISDVGGTRRGCRPLLSADSLLATLDPSNLEGKHSDFHIFFYKYAYGSLGGIYIGEIFGSHPCKARLPVSAPQSCFDMRDSYGVLPVRHGIVVLRLPQAG